MSEAFTCPSCPRQSNQSNGFGTCQAEAQRNGSRANTAGLPGVERVVDQPKFPSTLPQSFRWHPSMASFLPRQVWVPARSPSRKGSVPRIRRTSSPPRRFGWRPGTFGALAGNRWFGGSSCAVDWGEVLNEGLGRWVTWLVFDGGSERESVAIPRSLCISGQSCSLKQLWRSDQ